MVQKHFRHIFQVEAEIHISHYEYDLGQMTLQTEDDIDEYLKRLLNRKNEQHKKFKTTTTKLNQNTDYSLLYSNIITMAC